MKLISSLLHRDQKEFRASVEYTIAVTKFRAELVEKDYFCSVILSQLMSGIPNELIFKGGTLLTKVHTGYFRLSEDLDFSIPISPNETRGARSKKIDPVKKIFENLPQLFPEFKIDGPLKGSNESRQYNGVVEYQSQFSKSASRILVEIGLREQLVHSAFSCEASTLLLNPITSKPAIQPFRIQALTLVEAYGEKVRAAMCRTEPAIRDFFDLHVATEKGIIDLKDPEFRQMVKTKITSPIKRKIDLSDARVAILQNQLNSHLEPMLKQEDFNSFDLTRIIKEIRNFASEIEK